MKCVLKKICWSWTLLVFTSCTSLSIKKPFLYALHKDGQTSYIMGTKNGGIPYNELPLVVHQKLEQAKVVFLENDSVTHKNHRFHFETDEIPSVKEKSYSNDKTLAPNTWQFILSKLGAKHSLLELKHASPSSLYDMVVRLPEYLIYIKRSTSAEWKRQNDMDRHFAVDAHALAKEVRSLDNDETRVQINDCWNEDKIKKLDNLANGGKPVKVESLWSMEYRSGNESQVASNIKLDPKLAQCILSDRNKKWVPQVIEAHKSNAPLFIAVDVAHLVYGDDNVLELLSKEGFTIERVGLD